MLKRFLFVAMTLSLMLTLLSSCATNTQTRFALIGSSASAGAIIGYVATKDGDSKAAHSALWASFFGLVASLIGNYFYNNENKLQELKKENQRLKIPPRLQVIDEGVGEFIPAGGKRNEKVKGKYRILKIDKWIDVDENTKFHQNMKLEKIIIEKNSNEN